MWTPRDRLMSSHREQAHLDAPADAIWRLVGTPDRYPEWWPRVIEVQGERFEEGEEFVQVIQTPSGRQRSTFHLERMDDDLREIRMSCDLTGTYAHWQLTPAQGGTFVHLEMGMQPKRFGDRLRDLAGGRAYFRQWSRQSLAALEEAAARSGG